MLCPTVGKPPFGRASPIRVSPSERLRSAPPPQGRHARRRRPHAASGCAASDFRWWGGWSENAGPYVSQGEPCPTPSSSPPRGARSAGRPRARSSTSAPTTWPPPSSRPRSTRCRPSIPSRSRTSSWAAASPPARPATTWRRVVAILAGMPDVPGVTVNRYCSSSLQTIRMAAHAIKAGEGDVFIAAGVETVSRYMNGAADTGPHNQVFADAEARTAERTTGGNEAWSPPTGLPDIYIAMGQTAENVAEFEDVTRERHGRVRRPQPAAGHRLARARLLGARDHADHHPRRHGRHPATTASGPAPPSRGWPTSSPSSGPTARSPPATPARSTTAPPP